jgi:hypothetical protein
MSLDNLGTSATPEATPTAVAPSTPDPAIPDPSAAPSATPSGTPQPTRQSEGMVPSYRIRETREAALREAQTQWGAREQEYKSQLEAVQRQLHALVGVTPQGDPEVTAIRQQFEKLFPGLARLEQRAQDLEGLVDRTGDLTQQTQHYWASYGRQQLDRLFAVAEQSLGSPLTEEGKRALHTSFMGLVQSSPEMTERYATDPGLINEFWQQFASAFIDPVRRTAAATVETRTQHALPQDTPAGMPQATPAPKLGSLDDRVANAWASYTTTARPR